MGGYVYRMEQHLQMAEWRCVRMEYGAQSAMTSGVILMPVWYADSWAMILMVHLSVSILDNYSFLMIGSLFLSPRWYTYQYTWFW